jgi:hypothetical protein
MLDPVRIRFPSLGLPRFFEVIDHWQAILDKAFPPPAALELNAAARHFARCNTQRMGARLTPDCATALLPGPPRRTS